MKKKQLTKLKKLLRGQIYQIAKELELPNHVKVSKVLNGKLEDTRILDYCISKAQDKNDANKERGKLIEAL